MLWLRRPPYLRWAAAGLLVLAATWLEVRPQPTVKHPFAVTEVPAGAHLTEAALEWRAVPVGLLPAVSRSGTLRRPLSAGEPVLPSHLDQGARPPSDWWALEARVPFDTAPGAAVQMVILPDVPGASARAVPGIVIRSGPTSDPFLPDGTALVAVPPEEATEAAVAVAEGRVAVLVAPEG
ncbi:MAG: SAF domain-containing protein [Acidimicrobiia bacterium]